MKKLIALLLAAIMCFSLVACGGGETSNTDSNNEPQTSGNTDNGETELLTYIYGEWKPLLKHDEAVLTSVSISEEKIIDIDNSSFSWELDYIKDSGARFNVLENESKVGYFELIISENADIELRLNMDAFDNTYYPDGTVILYKPSYYEVISVNAENVYEYFELQDFWTESRNAFGELTNVRIDTSLVLKEQYYSRLSQNLMGDAKTVTANGAIEWLYKRSGLDVVVNLEEKTYTFENFKSGTEDTETGVQGFGCYVEYAGFWARFLQLTPDSEGRYTYTWACVYEMEITRLELDLYLLPETN